jgi:hypothetical protein
MPINSLQSTCFMFGIRDNNCYLASPMMSKTVITTPQPDDLVMYEAVDKGKKCLQFIYS